MLLILYKASNIYNFISIFNMIAKILNLLKVFLFIESILGYESNKLNAFLVASKFCGNQFANKVINILV